MSIIQQLEDLKEWSKDSTRYERRLAWRGNWRPSTEAGTIPLEFDELSPQEQQYYQNPPFSTHPDFLGAKGGSAQLVQPGPGRQGYQGKKSQKAATKASAEAATEFKTKVLPKHVKKLNTWIKDNVGKYKGIDELDTMYDDAVKHFNKHPYTGQSFGKNFVSPVTKSDRLRRVSKPSEFTFRLGDYSHKNIFGLGKTTTDATSKIRYVKDMMLIEMIENDKKLKNLFTDFYKGKDISQQDLRKISRFNKTYLRGATPKRPGLLRMWFQKLNPKFENIRHDAAIYNDSIAKQINLLKSDSTLTPGMRKKYTEAYTAVRRMSNYFRTDFVKEIPKTLNKKALDFTGKEIAKELFQWEHKVPRQVTDLSKLPASYLARTSLTPGTFNVFKMRYFDEPLDNLMLAYKSASPEKRGAIQAKIEKLYNDFNAKSGGYLDELKIGFDEKTGRVKIKDTTSLIKPTDYETFKHQTAKNILHADEYYKNIGKKEFAYDKKVIRTFKDLVRDNYVGAAELTYNVLEKGKFKKKICKTQFASGGGGVCGKAFKNKYPQEYLLEVARTPGTEELLKSEEGLKLGRSILDNAKK